MAGLDPRNADAKGCFARFSRQQKSGRTSLTTAEFSAFLAELFTDYDATKTVSGEAATAYLFRKFDLDRDGELSYDEFERMFHDWAVTVLRPKCALIVVDVQNDFISGTLSLSNCPLGDDPTRILPVINALTEKLNWTVVVYTYDWHPENHISFYENRMMRPFHPSSSVSAENAKLMDTVRFASKSCEGGYYEQKLWPRHCVQGTWGAELHADLKVKPGSLKIYKGTDPEVDSYSAFWDNDKKGSTTLHSDLRALGVTDVYVCGIAYDVCARFTALHASELGYGTVLIEDASSGVAAEGIESTKHELRAQRAVVAASSAVPDMVEARSRPFELGLRSAVSLQPASST